MSSRDYYTDMRQLSDGSYRHGLVIDFIGQMQEGDKVSAVDLGPSMEYIIGPEGVRSPNQYRVKVTLADPSLFDAIDATGNYTEILAARSA